MDVRFAQALKEPWRPSLRANLELVLGGATKTKKKPAPATTTIARRAKGRKTTKYPGGGYSGFRASAVSRARMRTRSASARRPRPSGR